MAIRSKLAVILHADVVGSTSLVQKNVGIAHERIRDAFRRCAQIVATYGGTAHELRGDALVAEFGGVSDAVSAALAFQNENENTVAAFSDDIRPQVRIGIGLGEVIVADRTLTGAGVVLAQRLEQLGEPGGVVVQGAAYETIPRRFPFAYECLGEQVLKGFDEPVRAYSVRLVAGADIPQPQAAQAMAFASDRTLAERPAVAILPFDNLSSDPDQDYFANGIVEDITIDLSKVSGLLVIARNSAFQYRGEKAVVSTVSRELGVRYVLQGSVRRSGDRVRVSAELIDAHSQGHLWAERYDRELTDIFAVQDDIVREIVVALAAKLSPGERARLGASTTDNMEAYDLFLRGRELIFRFTPANSDQAKGLLRRAIALSPQFAPAYAFLALALNIDYTNAWGPDPRKSLEDGYELALKAVAIDESLPQAYWVLGLTLTWMRQHDRAERALQQAIELNPSYAPGYSALGILYTYSGRPLDALEQLNTAMFLDPHYPDIALHFIGQAHFVAGRYEEAIEAFRQRLVRRPDTDITRVFLAASLGHVGNNEEAREQWAEALKVNPDYSLAQKKEVLPFRNPNDFARIEEGLRRAGVPC